MTLIVRFDVALAKPDKLLGSMVFVKRNTGGLLSAGRVTGVDYVPGQTNLKLCVGDSLIAGELPREAIQEEDAAP